jgi:predicted nucleic acid-binding protein
MRAAQPGVVYWDTSAIISALFRDRHSDTASAAARAPGTHLISSLGWAEVQAVIARIEREHALSPVLVSAAREAVERGPWVRLSVDPDRQQIAALARLWPLRGADLWHLAAAKALQADLPELRLLSFDTRLSEAARGEGFR